MLPAVYMTLHASEVFVVVHIVYIAAMCGVVMHSRFVHIYHLPKMAF